MRRSTLTEEDIFKVAREIAVPEARMSYVQHACGDDAGLFDRVVALLEIAEEERSFLEAPPAGFQVTADMPGEMTEAPGTVIGPYKLRERIGEGGFGVVYVAEQEQPVKRKVALKIIKPGMDTREVIARFEAERQALALMDHPNIAKVLDAGTTESSRHAPRAAAERRPANDAEAHPVDRDHPAAANDTRSVPATLGRPYFVMELVRGVPLTEFCDEQKLTTRERLQLFVDVCRAVQHAHQKGIIHRDLKPSNVMVTLHDDKPVAKVIDFGVSKALSAKLTEKTVYTAYGQMVGTPLYMSPEQAQLSALDVDTRSDIYSLGVLLYELLTGTTPFDKQTLQKPGFDEMRRIIREVDPPRPSARISTLKEEVLCTVCDNRNIDTGKLSRSLRGELDWIVMKALEKDRSRRYESASAFAADLERFLNDDPVEACPPSLAYRLRKFARRNRGMLTATALVAFALLIGTVVSIWQAVEAHSARKQAERHAADAEKERNTARQAVEDMYVEVAEKWLAFQPRLTDLERGFLEKALRYYEEFAQQQGGDPEIELEVAKAWRRVAEIRDKLGQHRPAETAFRESRTRLQQLAKRFPAHDGYRRELARTCNNMGVFFASAGRTRESEEALRKSLTLREQLARWTGDDEDRHELASSYLNVAALLSNDAVQARQALTMLRTAAKIWDDLTADSAKAKPAHRRGLAMTRHSLAHVAKNSGRFKEAEDLFRKSIEADRQLLKERPDHPEYRRGLALSCSDLGETLVEGRHYEPAAETLAEATAVLEELVADFPDVPMYREHLAAARNTLGVALQGAGRHHEAELSWQKSVELRKALVKEFPDVPAHKGKLAAAQSNLARALRDWGRLSEARTIVQEAIKHQRAALAGAPQNPLFRTYLRNHYWVLAETLLRMGDHAAAAAAAEVPPRLFPKSWKQYDRAAQFLIRCASLVEARTDNGTADAEKLRHAYERRACELWREAAARNPDTPAGRHRLARFLATCPDHRFRDPAAAVGLAEKALAARPDNAVYQNTLGIARYRSGLWNEAMQALQKSLALPEGKNAYNWFFLAMAHWQRGDQDDAAQCYRKAVLWMENNAANSEELLRFRVETEQLMEIENRPRMGRSPVDEHLHKAVVAPKPRRTNN